MSDSTPGALPRLKREEKIELARILTELQKRDGRITIRNYRPYAKQMAFHAAGKRHPERLFLAGNQLGKTVAGGVEVGYHLTGRYPDWWPGLRFDRPIAMWAGSDTGENTRDRNQRVLLGRVGEIGTAAIPGEYVDFPSIAMRRGTANAVDGVRIKHVSGGTSLLAFKSYDQGRQSWQGETLDFVWFDEEPPEDIYSEGLTRTNTTGGHAMITATPLLGMTKVIGHFYPTPDTPERFMVQMTIDDAGHYTPEERAKTIAKYPAHERDARARGIPMLGSGRIYPVAEEVIKVAPFAVPDWWPQIAGLDFGWTHPTAAVRIAVDRDADIVYVTHCYRRAEAEPHTHAVALKAWGPVPFAWPHDGENKTAAGAGEQLSKQYAKHGLTMLGERATFEDDRKASVEAGLMDLLDRMQTGRLKVFSHLGDWFEEYRQYHRAEGRVVKERDDLMDATRYATMMLRFAKVIKPRRNYLRGVRIGPQVGFMAG